MIENQSDNIDNKENDVSNQDNDNPTEEISSHEDKIVDDEDSSSQKTEAGNVTYANSITLTPGTVTTELDGDVLEVHALSSDMADDVKSGVMDKKVSWLEGNKNV